VGLEMIVLFDISAEVCESATDCFGWSMCCSFLVWIGVCLEVTLFWIVFLELNMLCGNSATGCGSVTDCVG
jgi:hypothetical protein